MTDIVIKQIQTTEQINAVRGLVYEFVDYAISLDANAKSAQPFQDVDEEMASLPGTFGPPDGAFLLATVDSSPAGCAAFFSHGNGVCELKRMYVRPEFRGLHIGDALTQSLIERAKAREFNKMVLSTFHTMKSAHRVYEKAGFEFCAPTMELPPQYQGKIVFMERDL